MFVASRGVESSAIGLPYEKSILAAALFSMMFHCAAIPLIFIVNRHR